MKSRILNSSKNALRLRTPILIAFTSLLILGGCASAPKTPEGAIIAREKLTQLQNDPALASKVSVAIRTADTAVKAAEIPRKDKALSDHLVFIAGREVDVAWTQAKTRQLEDQRAGLTKSAMQNAWIRAPAKRIAHKMQPYQLGRGGLVEMTTHRIAHLRV